MLEDMHKAKIDMTDENYMINVGGYIGSSTRSKIEYAETHGKPVNNLETIVEGRHIMQDRQYYGSESINAVLEEIAKRIETEAKTPEEAAAIIREYKNKKSE